MTRAPALAGVRHFPWRDLLVLFVFLALTAVFFWRPLFAGQPLSAADILYQSPPWQTYQATAPILPDGQLWNRLMSDNVYGYYPEEVVAVRFLQAGVLPLWDPYVFSGTPLLAESQRGVFYPLNLLVRLLPFEWAFSYGVILHFFLAACFMYALLRHWGLERGPAALGGLIFEFSGWMVSWVLTPYGIYTVIWLPLMLLCFDKAVLRRDPRWAVAAGVTIALQLFAGQIQFVSYNLLALGLLGLVRAGLALRRGWRLPGSDSARPVVVGAVAGANGHAGRPIRGGAEGRLAAPAGPGAAPAVGQGIQVAADQPAPSRVAPPAEPARASLGAVFAPVWVGVLAVVSGFALAAVQLLPTFELIGLSGRAIRAFDDMIDYDLMPLSHLFTVLVPYFYGSFLDGNYRGWLNMLETTFYFGLAPLVLAGIAVVRQSRAAVFFLLVAGLLPLIVLLFPAVFSLFYLVVPGFKQTFPSRLLYLVPFGFAGLAAFGASDLIAATWRGAKWPWRLAVSLAGVWLVAAVIGLLLRFFVDARPVPLGRFDWLWQVPFDTYGLAQAAVGLVLLSLVVAVLLLVTRRAIPARLAAPVLGAVIAVDLFTFGINYNPAFPPAALYPATPAIEFLQSQPEKGRLAAGDGVILPPNTGAVYGLEDVRGYTSLYSGRYQNVVEATQGSLPVFPLLEDGRPNRNHLLSIGRTDSPLFQALNPRFFLEPTTDLPVRSIRAWATDVTVHADLDGVFRPRARNAKVGLQRVIFAHPPAEVVYRLPQLPGDAQLRLGYGIDQPAWHETGDGVLFEVEVRRAHGPTTTVLQRWVDPKSSAEDRGWFEEQVPIPGAADGPVEVVLRTSSGPADDAWFDWALWSDPQIIFGRPLRDVLAESSAVDVRDQVSRDGVTHQSVWLAEGATLDTLVTVPEQGRLSFAALAVDAAGDWTPQPVTLDVSLDGQTVKSLVLDPAERPYQRHWTHVSVDLGAWAGRSVRLALTRTDGTDGWLAIGDPRLLDARLDPGLDLVYNDEVAIYQNDRAVDRAYLVANVQRVASPAEALTAATDPSFDPRQTVILEDAAQAPDPAGPAGTAEILAYRPNEVTIRTESNSPNYLVLADAAYPGWRATVDGQETPLYQANYIVRAVAVPPGEHIVRFSYLPRSLIVGGAISLATAALLAIGGVALWFVRRRRARAHLAGAS